MENIKVCCPSCNWQPDNKAHWRCECGTQWNAFDTLGRCPTCKKQWEYTQCVNDAGGCNNYALHNDWYQNVDEIVNDLIEELNINTKTVIPKNMD